jgi:lipoprotein-releasing system permease protein
MKGVDSRFDSSFFAGCMRDGHLPCRLRDTVMSDELMISHTLSKKLGLQVGMKAPVYFASGNLSARPFRICGIYETGLEEFDKTFAFCDIRPLRKLNRWDENQVTGIEIYNRSDELIPVIQEKIYAEGVSPFWAVQSVYQLYPQIFEWLALVDTNVYILLALMALVAVISMTTALVVLIIERTQMIGLLKSFGAKDRKLWGVFLFLAGRLMWRGMLLGNILSLGLCYIQQQFRLIQLDQESYYVKWVPVRFPVDQIIAINAGALLICFVSLLFPVMVISRTSPLKAIRFS